MQLVPNSWKVGDVILDLYKVTDILGEGGFGTVYKVRHQGWNIDLAVKSPKPEIVAAAGGVENFEREAETWVNLGLHPHTVSCYYVRRIESSPLVFAEYVAGGSLQDWIGERRLYVGGTVASLKRILDIAIQFAWGLHYAHEQGLIHQDVKPANVMLTPEGGVKVTDFGLAKGRTLADRLDPSLFEKGEGETYTLVTEGSGTMTPAYCSPEQAKRKTLTRRSDLWSWGLCVLEMFQGGRSWQAGIVAAQALEFYWKTWRKDSQLPQMPARVALLLQRCFWENPDERPRNMLAVVNELQGIYQQVTGEAYPREEPRAGKDTADTLNNRAVSLLDLGKQEEALQLWEQALKMHPQHPESTYNRGVILRRVGRIDDVALVREMKQMRQSNSENWVADYLLGLVHLERDDCEAAIETLQAIQGVNAGREEVQRLLAIAKERLFCLKLKQLFLNLERHVERDDCQAAIETLKSIVKVGAERKEAHELQSMAKECLSSLNFEQLFLDLEGHFEWDDCQAAIKTLKAIVEAGAKQEEVHELQSMAKECLSSLNFKQLFLDLEGHFERDDCQAAIKTLKAIVEVGAERKKVQDLLSMAKECLFSLNLKRLLFRLPFDRHVGQVYSIYLNAANRIALIGSDDCTVKLWKVATGRCLRIFKGHTLPVSSVYLGADGQFALSGSWDDTLKLWKVATGRCLRTFKGHTSVVSSVCLNTDSQFALSGSNDCTVKLWKVATGRCLRTFRGHKKSVRSVCISGDSSLALSGSDDGTVKLWEVTTGRCLHTFSGHKESVRSVCISGDSSLALSGSDDGTVKLWEVTTGLCLHTFEGHQTWVRLVCFSADNRFALSRSDDGTVKLWEVATGFCLRTFEGSTSGVALVCASISISVNGQFAWFGSSDQNQELLAIKHTPIKNLAPIELYSSFSDHRWVLNRLLKKLDFSLDAKRVLSSFLEMSNNKQKQHLAPTILSQVLATETLLSRSLIYDQELEQARAAVEQGDYEAAAQHLKKAQSQPGYNHHEDVVNAWTLLYGLIYEQELDLARAAQERGDYATAAQHLEKAQSQPGYNHHEEVQNAWSQLYGLIYEQELDLARVAQERGEYATAAQHLKKAQSQPGYNQHEEVENAWSQLYRYLPRKTFLDGWENATFTGHTWFVSSVGLSTDYSFALSGSWDKTLKLWEVTTGRCMRTFEGNIGSVYSVYLSTNNQFALLGSWDKTLKLWEVATGQCLRTFEGHTGSVSSVCLSADERFALSGSRDKTLKLWEVATGLCLRTFEGHTDTVNSICLSADSRFALSGSRDKTLKLWVLLWELEERQAANWDEGARPYLENFLTQHTLYAATLPEDRKPSDEEITLALTRRGTPTWTEEDFQKLLYTLGCAGYGWLRPEGVRKQLEAMAKN